MRQIHKVQLQVIAKPEEDVAALKEGLVAFVPFNLEEAKMKVLDEKATGFNERTLHIYTIELIKESHTNKFVEWLLSRLSPEQKDQLLRQKESRLDEELKFYIRFEKEAWLGSDSQDRKLILTDFGNCFHIMIHLAAYPANKEKGLELIDIILTSHDIA